MNKSEIKHTIELLRYHADKLGTHQISDTITSEQAREIVAQLKRIVADIWTMGIILDKIKVQKNGTKT